MNLIHILLLLGFLLLATWVAVRQVLFSGQVDGNAVVGAVWGVWGQSKNSC